MDDLLANSVPIDAETDPTSWVRGSPHAKAAFLAHIPIQCPTSVVWWNLTSGKLWVFPILSRKWILSRWLPSTNDPAKVTQWWAFMDMDKQVWQKWDGELPEL